MQEKIWEKIIKELETEEVIKILQDLGSSTPKKATDGSLIFQSVCHNSSSYKLYYYPENKTFFCFRDWEKFNIFSLVMKTKNCDFAEAYKYVISLLNKKFSSGLNFDGFGSHYMKEDWELFDKFNKIEDDFLKDKEETLYFNPDILNLYNDYYYEGWINENINIASMKKFGIKYDMVNNRIIIPHYDKDNNLLGIRCRNLNDYAEAKYCPIVIEDCLYSHPLGKNLYGLNNNKETIKSLKKIMIVESEKSVLQSESYFPDHNFVVACCGSNISQKQIDLLLELGVTEVILGMDWDFNEVNFLDEEYCAYKKKIMKLCLKLIPYFTIEVLLPTDEPFLYKCSPTDLGKDYLLKSMKSKLPVTYDMIINELERSD